MNGNIVVAAVAFAIGLVAGKLIYQQPPQLVAVPAVEMVPEEYLAPVSTGATGIAQSTGQSTVQPEQQAPDNNGYIADSQSSTSSAFSCDGRTMCSQMNSRAEAEFFIQNCPNTEMDGDNDGRPCERDSRFQ
jgi:hypothetical protein